LENGNYEIGVHIADVSHYVREGSELDKEAEKRATSVYLPDRVCPMLPEKLSNLLCSLRPNEDKLTFSTIFEFDKKFNIVNYSIAKTVIHSRRRFTYEEAQQRIETGQGDYAEEMLLLDKIAKHLRAKRFKKGAIAFEKAEVRFKLDETGKPIGIVLKVRKDSNLLVEDFMLLANETVARYGGQPKKGKRPQPFVNRIHDKPDPAKLEMFSAVAARFGYNINFDDPRQAAEIFNTLLKKIEGRPEQNALETLAIRSMAKAEYTTENIGHYGLAMEHYTHFTSPIRRYPDVLVHRLLFNLIADKNDVIIDKTELEARCKNSSLMERKAMDAEREATKYKQIEYLQDKVGGEFEGVITGVIARGIFVEMTDNKCEGMVSTEMMGDEDFVFEEKTVRLIGSRTRRKFQLGDKVKVKLLSADIVLRRIDMELLD
jgi:ribonuclease R